VVPYLSAIFSIRPEIVLSDLGTAESFGRWVHAEKICLRSPRQNFIWVDQSSPRTVGARWTWSIYPFALSLVEGLPIQFFYTVWRSEGSGTKL